MDTLDDLHEEAQNAPCAFDQLRQERKNLPELADAIRALAAFAKSLAINGKYWLQGERYVLHPNFVAFTVRHRRSRHLTISLRGNVREFDVASEVPIRDGRASAYSECTVSGPKQLAAAAAYIQRAHQIYERGATRIRKKPVKTEVPVGAR